MSRRTDVESLFTTDSFLDIVTNLVGVLVLIGVLVLVAAGDVKIAIGTPVLRDPPLGVVRWDFECVGNRITALPHEAPQLPWETSNYFIEANDRGGVTFFRKEGLRGDSVSTIRGADSAFLRHLSSLDPRRNWVYLHVREDSFPVFRAARKIALAKGFQVGWRPWRADHVIGTVAHGGMTPRPQ